MVLMALPAAEIELPAPDSEPEPDVAGEEPEPEEDAAPEAPAETTEDQ